MVFLKNGQEATLVEKLSENKYLVDPHVIWCDEYGNTSTDPTGDLKVVNEVYSKAPVDAIDKEYATTLEKVSKVKTELSEATTELRALRLKIKQQQEIESDFENWIINLSEYKKAENLVFFSEGKHIMPEIISKEMKNKGLTLTFRVNCFDGSMDRRVKNIDCEGYSAGYTSRKLDPYFGIKINLSKDEIESLISERIDSLNAEDFSKYEIERIPERYLNESFKTRLNLLRMEEKQQLLKKKQEQINKIKEEIKKLK